MTGVYLCPEKSAFANTTKKAKAWKPIKDPLAKRSPIPPNSLENGFRRGIRQQLVEACEKDDPKSIDDCIRAFEKNRLEDKGDLTRAREKIEMLNLKKGLFDAIHRRRVDLLDKAIAEVIESKFVYDLDPFPLRKAKKLREELSSLNSFNQAVSLLNQRTISELRTYAKIPDVVKNTMIAAFLMLGENLEDLKDWDFIRSVLGRTGTASVRLKMENFNPTKVPMEIAQKADSYLKFVHIDSVRQASIGCAAFYIWTKKAIAKVKGDVVYTSRPESDSNQADGSHL
ncbi:uncharacterized protein LOC135473073 [Liolophura sinensis]|uniref:uncharacterized protein LOC135473073 n=1 Tax=Liolophura sinensis TaxID=3198878 RepID=UPI0031596A7D